MANQMRGKKDKMYETIFNFQFGETRQHFGTFGKDIGINAKYFVDDYGNEISISFTLHSLKKFVIDIKRRFLLSPKVNINGKQEGKIISRHFKLRNPNWKMALELNGDVYCLIVESGPEKNLTFNLLDWKKAFRKEFAIVIMKNEISIGSISGPAWTLKDERFVKFEITDLNEVVPFLILTFLHLTETNSRKGD
jgi:hypothetical protein